VERASAVGPELQLTGFVDDEALCSLYHGARAVWFPSKYEGFGVPVLEAMACGAPVVTSDCTALPEVAGGAAVLVRPDAVSSHVEALTTVCDDGDFREALIAQGHTRANHFSWRTSATTLLSHFRSII
jgi:glycosyltransferase involved in cell wall biosynthesis